MLIPVQGVPTFAVIVPSTNNTETEQTLLFEGRESNDDSYMLYLKEHERIGAFSVNRGVLYAEYKRQLFKWEPGDAAWKDTGLLDTGEQPELDLKMRVQVSRFRRRLSMSANGTASCSNRRMLGNSWRDVTPNLPFHFTCFKEIVFAGPTVYIATDSGVLASRTGEHWRVIADEIVIDKFAVDGTTPQNIQIYGAGDTGGLSLRYS